MDRPASVTAALLGIALIAASLPFLLSDDDGSTEYLITWSQTELASDDLTLAVGSTVSIPINVVDAQPSNATVTIDCNDNAVAPLQGAVTVTWRLFQNGTSTPLDEGTTGCPEQGFPVTVPLGGHADVGSVKADNSTLAKQEAEDRDARSTGYRLEVQVTRAAGTGPGLPVGAPTFTGSAELTIQQWSATANDPDEEATR